MSERERWIVYPLLFLALGAALRDKLVDRTMTRRVVCQELIVVDAEPLATGEERILARIRGSEPTPGVPSFGILELYGHANVRGTVNARQYAYHGVPLVSAPQPVLPGILLPPELLRALQQAAQAQAVRPDSPPEEAPPPLADPADPR